MTSIVGVLCKDGVVIGSDSSATFAYGVRPTIEQPIKKVDIIEKNVIVVGTGQIGLDQRFTEIVKEAYSNKLFSQKPYIEIGRSLAQSAIDNFASTRCEKGQCGALLAYATGDKFFLCEFAVADFQPEWKNENIWYVSLGCGQPITDPFLGFMRRIFWKEGMPNVADAIFVVTWTLQHAIDLNAGGINKPIQLGVLRPRTKERDYYASLITDQELQEHMNNVDDVEKYLTKYKETLLGERAATIPSVE